jgi:predicted neuraminidase
MKKSIRALVLAGMISSALCAAANETAFLEPARHVGPGLPLHAVTNRAFQGISSLAVTPEGRLWATWYAGKTVGEGPNNYVVLSTSGDQGETWREVLVVDPDEDGPVRTFDPEIWMAPDGKLRLFWAQSIGHDGAVAGVWSLDISNPESEQPQYGKPVRLTDGVMMCKPLALSSGEWVLPASTWRTTDSSARFVVSTDQGKTWVVRGGCNVPVKDRAYDEHQFIERKDGSIWLLVRTKYGIGESVSTDRGATWPDLKPSAISHPCARSFITRLNSGNLLLVKHGPIDEWIGRSHLMAFISTDDGKTWGGGLMLDEREGVSYPDGQQAEDGIIWITYDYSRSDARHILMAAFREEDAAAGKAVTDTVRLRQLISDGSGGVQKAVVKPVHDNQDGEPLQTTPVGACAIEGVAVYPCSIGQPLFTDRSYVLENCPRELAGADFLRTPMMGKKTMRCTRAGMIYFLTPAPDRNRDSQSDELIEQGFKKVALPEVKMFRTTSSKNYGTLYQKMCTRDEVIIFGKWAVPVFVSDAEGSLGR